MTHPQLEQILDKSTAFAVNMKDQVLDKTDKFMSDYPTLSQNELFVDVEKKTGYPKQLFFLLALCVLAGILFFVGGPKLVTDLVAFCYPAYMSFKTIDNNKTITGPDDQQWLTYWVVYATFALTEQCGGYLLLQWIPMYFWIKIAFLAWLYHPKTKGASLVYQQGIRPLILPYLPKETTKKAE